MSSLIQAVKGAPPLRTFVPVDVLIKFSFYLLSHDVTRLGVLSLPFSQRVRGFGPRVF